MGARFLVLISHPIWVDETMKTSDSIASSRHKFIPFRAMAARKTENFENPSGLVQLGPISSCKLKTWKGSKCLPEHSTILKAYSMVSYAYNGDIHGANLIWDELINSSFVPDVTIVCGLINAFATRGYFSEIRQVLDQVKQRRFTWLRQAFSHAVCCLGMGGELLLMEMTLKEMVSMGFTVDSVTANVYLCSYATFGTLQDAQAAYGRLKKSRILIEERAITAVSFAYLKEKQFYHLGEFLRDVGLGRRNSGNLLWNLLLLSYAVNFKMKSLQRTFVAMVEAGFKPDLTTFNIRALAFSKMNLFWDLHLSLEHMKHANVAPDLVTYGCVVDAYLDKKMGKNLDFAFQKIMNLDDPPVVATEPYVFEFMGKGDFHSSCDAFMEFSQHDDWTYKKLVGLYIKKYYRSNQIFWNY